MITRKKILTPKEWGLDYNSDGELLIKELRFTDLAREFGTPLYVLNEERLKRDAENFREHIERIFNGNASVFYPFKCNSVPGIVNAIKKSGISAEVMTVYELKLALKLGFAPEKIIVNGPCKTDAFLKECLIHNVKFIIIDSLSELKSLIEVSNQENNNIKLLLRINPDYIPKGLYKGSATGSKKSSFGMAEREILDALIHIKDHPHLKFCGLHFHIGTGIREPKAYSLVIKKLYPLFNKINLAGFKIDTLDVGGGFASMTTRELTSFEMLASQVLNSYELKFRTQNFYSIKDFLIEIKRSVQDYFGQNVPTIFFEPGRCIVSPNLILLLKVHRIKQRNNKKWLITNGGLGTITMPTYYEYHQLFLCSNYKKPLKEKVTITGPCCFASDIVYKNKMMPEINEGEVLALMDTGAYFIALESSFNFPKPAIISIQDGYCKILRRHESFNDMFSRNEIFNSRKEIKNEIFSC